MSFNGWAVALNGVATSRCGTQADWDDDDCFELEVIECLDAPPSGVGGTPGLRTEDVTYYQRDGVQHFSDWYEPRLITITGTVGDPTDCPEDCSVNRQLVADLRQAWKRDCCDTELVIYTDCNPDPTDVDANRDLNGPVGVVGRPRVFDGDWDDAHKVFEFTARFDAVDQRMYVLDGCGTPGFTECEPITPGPLLYSICFADPICMDGAGFCFTEPVESPDSVPPVEIVVGGTEKVNPTITLFPPLVSPRVENLTTGEFVELDTTLLDPDTPVTINTEDGTAFDADGNSLTHLLRGSLFLSMFPGIYSWRLISNGVDVFEDPGYMTLCWRNTLVGI